MADQRKSVLITGTSSGIGHSLAREFNSKGLRVFATARTTDKIADLAALGIETLPLELTDPSSIANLLKLIQERVGERGLDYLVNNAGRNYTVPATDVDFDEVHHTFDVNVYSVMRMCQTFVPELIKAKGTIVQIGSVAGIIPYVFGSTYNATKAALHAYSNTLRTELQPFGVKVVVVVTGGVQSQIARTDRQLPEGSLFVPINDEYQDRVRHSQASGSMPSDAYAKSVVRQVLSSSPARYVWEGNRSWLIRFVTGFFGIGPFDFIFWRMFKLWKLIPSARRSKL